MTDSAPPSRSSTSHSRRPPTARPPRRIGLGVALLLIGVLLFVGQIFDIGINDVGWPVIVIGIGVVILVLGLFVNREQGMVIGGTVVTTVGLVLLYQNTTGAGRAGPTPGRSSGRPQAGSDWRCGALAPRIPPTFGTAPGRCSAGSESFSSASSSSRA